MIIPTYCLELYKKFKGPVVNEARYYGDFDPLTLMAPLSKCFVEQTTGMLSCSTYFFRCILFEYLLKRIE